MAFIAIPAIGAAVGAAWAWAGTWAAVASAAAWGWTAGSLLYSATHRTKLPPNQGARLSDLKVQISSYGAMITIVHGRMRVAGNVIEAEDIVEHAETSTVRQGKGGAEQESTTYWYSCTFGVLVCDGAALGIRRIWGNGKLIYDVSLGGSPDGHIASHQVHIYLGEEDQEPSALMEAIYGAGNVPAYRGRVRVEFDTLGLGPYGGRLPNLEFEVIRSGTIVTLDPQDWFDLPEAQSFYASYSGDNNTHRAAQPTANTEYVWVVLDTAGSPRKLALINSFSHAYVFPPIAFDGNIALAAVDSQNRAWISQDAGTDEGLRIVTQSGAVTKIILNQLGDGDPERWNRLVVIDDDEVYLLYNGTAAAQWTLKHVALLATRVITDINTGRWQHRFLTNAGAVSGRVYAVGNTLNATTAANARLGYAVGTAWTTLVDYNRDDILPEGIVGSDYLYLRSANTGEGNRIEKRTHAGALVDYVTLTGLTSTNYSETPLFSLIDNEAYLVVQIASRIWKIATGTMEEELAANAIDTNEKFVAGSAYQGLGVVVVQIGTNNTMLKIVPQEPLIDIAAPTLGSTVTELIEMSPMTAADIDVTDLAGISCDGFALTQQGSIRDALELLRGAYQFDAVESDYKIKFPRRDNASIVTIPQDDLGARAPGEAVIDPLKTTRMQELELPRRVHINYIARGADYQIGKQTSKRIATESQQEVTIGLPIVLTDQQAAQLAEAAMYEAWTMRESHELATSRKYALYEPTDVITAVAGGVNNVLRLIDKHEGANGVIRWRAVTALSDAYTQVAPGATAGSEQVLTPLAPTEPVFLDTHLLRDEDDVPGFYFAAYGLSDAWSGAKLYDSHDEGVSYAAVTNGLIPTAATVGVAETALAAISADLVEFFDWADTVQIRLFSGTLSSYTRAQILAGTATPYLLDDEIFYAITASLAAGVYTLSGLLRGRAGTESHMTHAVGERFVVLDATLRSIEQDAADIGIELDYKAVSIGSTLQRTSARAFTDTALRLKPLAGVHFSGAVEADGDIVLAWDPRTRLDAALRDLVDAPMGETRERYEVDIWRDGAVVRTLEVTTATATYTEAQQIVDFGAAVTAGLQVDAYQISDEYGRGYPLSRTFEWMTPHLYWRFVGINVLGGGYLHLSQLLLYSDGVEIAGATVTSNYTPSVGVAGNLVDGTYDASNVAWNEADAEAGDFYIRYQLATAAAANGVKQGGNENGVANRFMESFTLEYSDDGASWMALGSKTGLTEPPTSAMSALYSF